MNGDVLTDIPFCSFFDKHVSINSLFTISSFKRIQKIDYGVLEIDQNNSLVGFREKPEMSYEVSMGIYMVNKKVLQFIPEGISYGFDKLMLDLMRANNRVLVENYEGYWLDIGRPDDYMQAIEQFESMRNVFLNA
jgi:NDP-sugar pyrophosphorylase family protein